MAKCYICDKATKFGKQVSHSHRKSSRAWKPNTKRIKILEGATPKTIDICTRCLRSGKVTRAI